MKSLMSVCTLAAAMLVLAGCGGGSGATSTSSSVSASPPTTTSSGSTSGSASGSTSGSGSSSGSSGSTTPSNKGTATLIWTAPTSNSDGSALTNLAGYYIYYGTTSGALSNVIQVSSASTLTYAVSSLGTGTWYFAVAAYTNDGLVSPMSNVGSKTIS